MLAGLIAAAFIGIGLYVWSTRVTPRLLGVTCNRTSQGSVLVKGGIYNPSAATRTFAVIPTVIIAGRGKAATNLHVFVTVPARSTRNWAELFSTGNVPVAPGTTVLCAPRAFQDSRPADD
jgi:hypothetical protein